MEVCRPLLDPDTEPWIECEDQRFAMHPVDPKQNADRDRPKSDDSSDENETSTSFDPNTALVETITRGLRRRENVLSTGEPGVGKTCVLRAVRDRLSETDIRLNYLHNSTLSRRDFYRQLCVALDLDAAATVAKLFHAVSTHVEELGRDQTHPVLLIDEAQLLRQETLEHLHILLNYDWDRQPLLSLSSSGYRNSGTASS